MRGELAVTVSTAVRRKHSPAPAVLADTIMAFRQAMKVTGSNPE
jgi:hypothetical protein